ncbi:putative protein kinase RLK-Pelle-RLCK-VI family [Helianthus annuus]|uniref:Protein kinase domain-containing protein n=1 Tax=Helianthus annuus TaxID=4232 RepID=A0A9K3HJR6_HELAN|nr:putative protein kinase RLK-Pelle-RLCK-VI family [Helianthus annuus]KAJ0490846.1 putative protein kinase RLK-Pelle-RLCK-VI family [Helianthus annuus]KAJ0495167.1 putative protein kinase RLK-Pelle-RLCK-VI family [Helianthus annuus]KAJ0679639.1 putative protein kinase RLK-Pelle-RLCK-VI family [Helianthus annuus]KAJ0868245.1 putative protein kinase RLK-Pelle-RLCK-VI family [Helianthus annuus]
MSLLRALFVLIRCLEGDYLSDFGLAKWATPTGLQITSTNVAGTFRYLAPEYFTHGKVTEKIDVYAFCVVLLELLTGRKPISNGHLKGDESLVMWAKPVLNSEKFSRLLDPILGVDYDVDQMECMALAVMLCIKRVPRARPQITIVSLLFCSMFCPKVGKQVGQWVIRVLVPVQSPGHVYRI